MKYTLYHIATLLVFFCTAACIEATAQCCEPFATGPGSVTDFYVCSGETLTVNLDILVDQGTYGCQFCWSDDGGISLDGSDPHEFTFSQINTTGTTELIIYDIIAFSDTLSDCAAALSDCYSSLPPISVNLLPEPVANDANFEICSGDNFNFDVGDIVSDITVDQIDWMEVGGPLSTGAIVLSTLETVNTTGGYVERTFLVTPSTMYPTVGLCQGDQFEVKVKIGTEPNLTSISPDQICLPVGSTTTFTLNSTTSTIPPTKFYYEYPSGVISSIGSSFSVSSGVMSEGSNDFDIFEVISLGTGYQCVEAPYGHTIEAYQTPEDISSLPSVETICDGEEIDFTLTSSTGGTYDWTNGSTFEDDVNTLMDNPVGGADLISYFYVITPNGSDPTAICNGEPVNLQVNVVPVPRFDLFPDTFICSGGSIGIALDPLINNGVSNSIIKFRAVENASINRSTTASTFVIGDTIADALSLDPGATEPATQVYKFYGKWDGSSADQCDTPRQTISVVVNPQPGSPMVALEQGIGICENSSNIFAYVTSPIPAGLDFDWIIEPASAHSFKEDPDNPGIVQINFGDAATALITTTASFTETCSSAPFELAAVDLSTGLAPDTTLIGKLSGELDIAYLCLDINSNSYQWGVDDFASLTPTTWPGSQVITGETASTLLKSSDFDEEDNLWVLTENNGCFTRNYYYSPTTGFENGFTKPRSLAVSPNPVNSQVTISMDIENSGDYLLQLFNQFGQVVFEQKHFLVSGENNLSILDLYLNAGMYFLTLKNEKVEYRAKLISQ